MKPGAASHLFGFMAVILAAAAVISETGALPPATQQVLFGQGAFVPLVRAEEAVKAQNPAGALENFHAAILRAKREGRNDIANRILLRMFGAGKELAARSLESGWPLLSQAALLSPDFSAWSARVERWALETGRGNGRFEYVIVNNKGLAEAWGIRPQKAALWLYRKLSPGTTLAGYPGCLYNLRVAELPAEGSYSYCWNIPLRLNGEACKTAFEVRGALGAGQKAFLSLDNLVRWQAAEKDGEGAFVFKISEPMRAYGLDRFLFTANGPCPKAELVAVHAYEPLFN
ncbi:MAG: hypothetical protein JHC34_05495 [Acidobacteria bacterium]|nr:hypothetical protein [Acidobacteriota bacterium]